MIYKPDEKSKEIGQDKLQAVCPYICFSLHFITVIIIISFKLVLELISIIQPHWDILEKFRMSSVSFSSPEGVL